MNDFIKVLKFYYQHELIQKQKICQDKQKILLENFTNRFKNDYSTFNFYKLKQSNEEFNAIKFTINSNNVRDFLLLKIDEVESIPVSYLSFVRDNLYTNIIYDVYPDLKELIDSYKDSINNYKFSFDFYIRTYYYVNKYVLGSIYRNYHCRPLYFNFYIKKPSEYVYGIHQDISENFYIKTTYNNMYELKEIPLMTMFTISNFLINFLN